MKWSFYALILGFCIDLLLGDPHGFPHPVVLIGKLIDALGGVFGLMLGMVGSCALLLLISITSSVSVVIP